MNKLLQLLLILLYSSIFHAKAQEPTPKPPKQIGIRLNKELFGTGLSIQLNSPMTKNEKWFLSQSLGFTVAHPQYDFIYYYEFEGWGPKMKFFNLKINYPLAGNYNLGINYRTNNNRKLAFYSGMNFSLFAGEQGVGSTNDFFYIKNFYCSINILPKFGIQYKIHNNLRLMFDTGAGYSIINTDKNWGGSPSFNHTEDLWYNGGISLMWNWK